MTFWYEEQMVRMEENGEENAGLVVFGVRKCKESRAFG